MLSLDVPKNLFLLSLDVSKNLSMLSFDFPRNLFLFSLEFELEEIFPLLLSSLFRSHVSRTLCLSFPATAGCPKGALSANWAASQHREQERRGEAEIFMRQFSRKLKIFRSKSSPPPQPPPTPSQAHRSF